MKKSYLLTLHDDDTAFFEKKSYVGKQGLLRSCRNGKKRCMAVGAAAYAAAPLSGRSAAPQRRPLLPDRDRARFFFSLGAGDPRRFRSRLLLRDGFRRFGDRAGGLFFLAGESFGG